MKKLMLIFGILLMFSCVKTDDFAIPELVIQEDNFEGNLTTIASVKGNFNFETEEIYTFRETETYISGYVISSDAAGNFYKEIILQDKVENPTAGIQILVDDNSLFETYDFGRKIYIKLDGLSLGFNNGVLQLGVQNRGDVVAIPNSLIDNFITRSSEVKEIKPLRLKISEFSSEFNNMYIKLENVQFDRNFVREDQVFSFASNPADRYDGERQLESCETGETTFLSTSTFSNFKSLLIPSGSGSIEGILTRDFYDEHFVIVVNLPTQLDMNGPRCDPEFLKCSENQMQGSHILFEENFDGVTSNTTLNARDFTNVNVSGGEKKFAPMMVNGNRILRISAYNTIENPLEAWLVTPKIDLDILSDEVLNFDILSSYDNGLLLKVFLTHNFTGDPKTTEWLPLDANIPLGPSGSYSEIFKKSAIDLSCLEGKVWIGFQYLGGAPDKTTTYDLDNIRVTGN
ncbi:DUF5689 domain-containing protein [Gramella sp. AN32]|uniref:DUF5689 domain-containing protein n=1 Tax=Christiangramia antarctica TaxID=2058158 RepID=A0ABW5X048_9FLAO|nr:DUF5689 domain-containing protein [Gramella sp. AN32]MCM4155139.1 hypothetical protein [Gramella sp. AN32]